MSSNTETAMPAAWLATAVANAQGRMDALPEWERERQREVADELAQPSILREQCKR